MKKTVLNLGKTLNKAEQKSINGGYLCHCNGTTYYVADPKWCGWKCGAGTIEDITED
ncbi:hypothetical protein [Tenacibaculum sp. SDUM215027]|uniref:hypothetical protein n=1 Tax=Tenacibaculum sp. SDUM215027 TaxID=3422596 RepID=UPI003D323DFE